MAVHTGETDERDRDYYGQVVNRCARLRALAVGRQVLVFAATHALVHTALPEGAWLYEIGEMRLRHLQQAELVYELLHPALPDESPRPRTGRRFARIPSATRGDYSRAARTCAH